MVFDAFGGKGAAGHVRRPLIWEDWLVRGRARNHTLLWTFRPLGSSQSLGGLDPFLSHAPWTWDSRFHTLVLQANNDILTFLSGMPVTRNTKYLDLKNSVSQSHVPSHPTPGPSPLPRRPEQTTCLLSPQHGLHLLLCGSPCSSPCSLPPSSHPSS